MWRPAVRICVPVCRRVRLSQTRGGPVTCAPLPGARPHARAVLRVPPPPRHGPACGAAERLVRAAWHRGTARSPTRCKSQVVCARTPGIAASPAAAARRLRPCRLVAAADYLRGSAPAELQRAVCAAGAVQPGHSGIGSQRRARRPAVVSAAAALFLRCLCALNYNWLFCGGRSTSRGAVPCHRGCAEQSPRASTAAASIARAGPMGAIH